MFLDTPLPTSNYFTLPTLQRENISGKEWVENNLKS